MQVQILPYLLENKMIQGFEFNITFFIKGLLLSGLLVYFLEITKYTKRTKELLMYSLSLGCLLLYIYLNW